MQVSIVSPVYRAENNIDELVKRITKNVELITKDFEIILVEDGSPDNSWQKIQEQCARDERIKGLKLSRNFGQHYAITAGIESSKGEWVVVMDCDLQDRPEEIAALYTKAQDGYEIVLARRFDRKDNFFKILTSSLFYKFLGYLTATKQDRRVANFGIYHRKVIQAICSMKESIRYFPTMVNWVGFRMTKIEVEHSARFEGKTSYNFKKLLKLALNIVLAYSDKPIRLLVKFGFAISIFSFALALYEFYKWQSGEIKVLGYASLIISVWFLSGMILSMIGLVGLYVGKTFEGVKNRPIYIIDEALNIK